MWSLKMFCLFASAIFLSITAAFPSSDVSSSTPTDCGGGYKKYESGNCYQLFDEYVAWDRANSRCTEEGGYLAIVKNSAEAQIIKNLVSDQSGWAWIWIGLRDKESNNVWTSIHDDPVDDIYHTWVSTASYKNHCGALTHLAELEDQPCSEKLAFVCEKTA